MLRFFSVPFYHYSLNLTRLGLVIGERVKSVSMCLRNLLQFFLWVLFGFILFLKRGLLIWLGWFLLILLVSQNFQRLISFHQYIILSILLSYKLSHIFLRSLFCSYFFFKWIITQLLGLQIASYILFLQRWVSFFYIQKRSQIYRVFSKQLLLRILGVGSINQRLSFIQWISRRIFWWVLWRYQIVFFFQVFNLFLELLLLDFSSNILIIPLLMFVSSKNFELRRSFLRLSWLFFGGAWFGRSFFFIKNFGEKILPFLLFLKLDIGLHPLLQLLKRLRSNIGVKNKVSQGIHWMLNLM